MPSSSRRPDNVAAAAESPAPSPNESVANSTTSEPTDHEWALSKYSNFKAFVHSLIPQEKKLEEWAEWLDRLPLSVFLAGGDGELKGVRGALTDERRAEEAGLVLQRWGLTYHFCLDRLSAEDQEKMRRYVLLFSAV
jgi:hypothetical protein